MNYKVETIAPFRKEVKKLIKKYPSLKDELAALGEELSVNPNAGLSLGNNCNKVRIAIKSKGKGKSAGARVITHIYITGNTVYLLYIYDKSERENLSDSYIKELLKYIHS
jgi:mRNA-degrading endonuclease RelE of RelBE toxin-antitoxin system